MPILNNYIIFNINNIIKRLQVFNFSLRLLFGLLTYQNENKIVMHIHRNIFQLSKKIIFLSDEIIQDSLTIIGIRLEYR